MTDVAPVSPLKKPEWQVPFYLVLFFLTFMTIDGFLVYLAISTNPGVIQEKAYETGLHYNQVLKAVENQKKLGLTSSVRFDGVVGESGTLQAQIMKAGKPFTQALVVKAEVVRPTSGGHDFTVQMTQVSPGVYDAPVQMSLPGLWQVRIYAEGDGVSYQQNQNLIVK